MPTGPFGLLVKAGSSLTVYDIRDLSFLEMPALLVKECRQYL